MSRPEPRPELTVLLNQSSSELVVLNCPEPVVPRKAAPHITEVAKKPNISREENPLPGRWSQALLVLFMGQSEALLPGYFSSWSPFHNFP